MCARPEVCRGEQAHNVRPYMGRNRNLPYFGYFERSLIPMKQMLEIVDVLGREILDSRGNPTVEVEIVLA